MELVRRVLITVTLGPLALLLVWLGDPDRFFGLLYFVPVVIFLAIATVEYVQITRRIGWQTHLMILLPLVLLQYVLAQWAPQFTAVALVVSFVIIMCYGLWRYERAESDAAPVDWLTMTAGLMLLGWLAGHFLRLRAIGGADTLGGGTISAETAWMWTTLALLGTWFADSFAYLVGKFVAGKFVLGKHKMSPRLSPNKTVEGYVGGAVLGTAATLLIGVAVFQLPFTLVLMVGLLTSIISPAGDLSISLLKRVAGVKDSGNLFPGHGGALDRIDSLMWSVAFVYYLLILAG